MKMLKALYYPHTNIRNEVILKNALLLWDGVETIAPAKNWKPERKVGDRWFNEAVDLVVQPRVPTHAERRSAHAAVVDALHTGELASLVAKSPKDWAARQFLVYPEKFLPATWHSLESRGMAQSFTQIRDLGVPPAVGFLLLSFLADSCAGMTIRKITDRVDAYGWIARRHASLLGSHYVKGFDMSEVAPNHPRLAALSLMTLDARRLSLKSLVQLRQRELQSSKGSDYADMRHRYLKALDEHIDRVRKDAKTARDFAESQRQFFEDMRADVADLKTELKLASIKTLFSKEVAMSALVVAGAIASPIAGVSSLPSAIEAVGIIPLVGTLASYRGSRRDILRRHTMSWLYLATRGPITLY